MGTRSRSPNLAKAQVALEFLLLIAITFVIFIGVTYVVTQKILDLKEQDRMQTARSIAELAQREILLAHTMSDGYNRTFDLPAQLHGISYGLQVIDDRELVVTYVDSEYVLLLPINTLGTLNSGENQISKNDGIVHLNE